MARRFGFKPSIKQRRRLVRAAVSFGVQPDKQARFEADFPAIAPSKPRAAAGSDGRPLEADVLRAVGDLLAVHPRVSYALRVNSGAASYEAKSGKWAPVHFHIWVRSPEPCRMPDFFGALTNGRTIAFECKRPGFLEPRDERERQQLAFLKVIRALGGIGGFITDARQVEELLG